MNTHDITHRIHEGKCLTCISPSGCNGTCSDKSTISTCLVHTFFSTGANPPPTPRNTMGIHYSSKTDEWETPQWLFDEYNTAYHFQMDVASTKENKKCHLYWDKEGDALKEGSEWLMYGNAWMNPPYGREIGRWVEKAFQQSNKYPGKAIVCLLPARTDTKWFHDYCMAGDIRFLKGRLKFSNSKNSAPFPSMIVIFKSEI